MEKEVIRVWFCNRRQKEKRINPCSAAPMLPSPGKPASYSPHLVHRALLGHPPKLLAVAKAQPPGLFVGPRAEAGRATPGRNEQVPRDILWGLCVGCPITQNTQQHSGCRGQDK